MTAPASARLAEAMIAYYKGDARRVHHFLAVYGFAKAIAELEGVDAATQNIIEAAALAHDIGIKASIERYGSYTASSQEEEGPPVARPLLASLGYAPQDVERICHLIGNHHTYDTIDGIDYQILVEADFLVNIHGHNMDKEGAAAIKHKIFATAAGKRFHDSLYGE